MSAHPDLRIEPMSEAEFDRFRALSTKEYAESMAKESGSEISDALKKSEAQFEQLLPEGIKTADNFFYHVKRGDERLGHLWFGIRVNVGKRRVYIFDIRIEDKFQRQGLGEFAMVWLEGKTRELGLDEIGLHVFGYNQGARAMYEKLGYYVTNLNMAKKV